MEEHCQRRYEDVRSTVTSVGGVNDDAKRQSNYRVREACEDAYARKAGKLAEEEKHGPRPVSRAKMWVMPGTEQFA